MDQRSKDRFLRNVTIAATAVSAALLLSADYGPNPHALSSISESVRGVREWFWTPSASEQAEVQRRLEVSRNKDSSADETWKQMAATVRLATRLDVPLINKMVHELAHVEGTASSCKSTETKLNELLFKHAPFHGPTIFLLEVDEPASKEASKEEAMSGTVVLPLVKTIDEDSTVSVELMLFRSISNVKYNGRFVSGSSRHSDFLSEVSSPKSSPLQTSDMEDPVLEVFRSRSVVNSKDHEVTIGEVAVLRSVTDPDSEAFKVAYRIVVGFVHVFPNFSTYLSKAGMYMEAFYIRKPYGHMGLGTMFLKKIAREAVKLGMERMEWSVLYSNDPAIKFYEGMGAVIKPGFRKCAIDGEALAKCEP